MFIRRQVGCFRLLQNPVEELLRDVAFQQTIPILTEHRRHPHRLVRVQTDKPPEQQVVLQLLHQHPLTADRVQNLQQQGSQQLLGRYRRASERHIHPMEHRRQCLQGNIRHQADCPQWMIRRHSIFRRKIAEHRTLLNVFSAHCC